MFSYRRAEEYPFFCFAVLYNLLSQVPVCCFHKKKKIQRKKEKGTQNIKKNYVFFHSFSYFTTARFFFIIVRAIVWVEP